MISTWLLLLPSRPSSCISRRPRARLPESARLHCLALQRRQSQQFQLQYRHQAAQQAFNAFPTGEALRFVDAEIHQPPRTDHSLDVSDNAFLEVSPDPGEIFPAGECVVNMPPPTPENTQEQQQREPRSPEEECLIGELEHMLSRQPSVEPSTSESGAPVLLAEQCIPEQARRTPVRCPGTPPPRGRSDSARPGLRGRRRFRGSRLLFNRAVEHRFESVVWNVIERSLIMNDLLRTLM
ncbi:uncharacterized protein LOC129605017 [Betta splendens]|uniref:Uncharacterized protein LOC129605017 n=1 Tax=Betta splendens TaxID=158456 RepID=A0A9W2Y7U5_BETSP|nr:uncharacterized protein LOC129605017 [Betta splendens]XP_055370032.1 uncharacterized protein LOC129605017 [Betta splendens]